MTLNISNNTNYFNWSSLKSFIQQKLHTQKDKDSFNAFFSAGFGQEFSQFEYYKRMGLEEVLYEYFGSRNSNPDLKALKTFLTTITKIDQNIDNYIRYSQELEKLANFAKSDNFNNVSQLNSDWILKQLQIINEQDLYLLITDEDEYVAEYYEEWLNDEQNKKIIQNLQEKAKKIVDNNQPQLPQWLHKHLFRILLMPEVLDINSISPTNIPSEIMSILKNNSLYKLQFCEPKKIIYQDGKTLIFQGLKTGTFFLSKTYEMVEDSAVSSSDKPKYFKLIDYILEQNNNFLTTMHFDPFHRDSPTIHVNYVNKNTPSNKLSLQQLAAEINQPKNLLQTYFTDTAIGAHMHIFFPQINTALQNDYENIAISVPQLARYTLDIFLATAVKQQGEVPEKARKIFGITSLSIDKNTGKISYQINTRGSDESRTIPTNILANDLGMHYTMFADGALSYNEAPFVQYLLSLSSRKDKQIKRSKEDAEKLKEYLTTSTSDQKYNCWTVLYNKFNKENQSAFETNSSISQKFNGCTYYYDNNVADAAKPKPTQTTFIIAMIYHVFSDIHTWLSDEAQAQIMSILHGHVPPAPQNIHDNTPDKNNNSIDDPTC
ncbi:MAG: hypothetical protein J6A28_02900 [Clostridia bacterium]|nr:hypothetical protein [Clostridia bacterium]